jgi:antitoxin (DNA-binding transcriptional repressor) of toxin-antitoxin stability system
MKAVGIREMKKRLSEYLRRVQRGEEILVTHRGTVVAEIRKPGQAHAEVPYPGVSRRPGTVGQDWGSPRRAISKRGEA